MAPLRVSRRAVLAAPALAVPLTAARVAAAAEEGFGTFLASVGREALAHGIREATVAQALRGTRFLPHVVELDHRQPERVLTFEEYLAKVVTPDREEKAREHLRRNRSLLYGIWQRYRVDPRFIVALWGVESDFGAITGDYSVPSAVATLAYDGRRGSYFRGELIAALRILDHGDIGFREMTGSWAGAMGQCQFMPSTYLGYAVDYDGDGRRDIWGDRADVLASIANYLARLGWRGGEGWGREVRVPAGLESRLYPLESERPLAEWRRLGVRPVRGGPLLGPPEEASLVLPEGSGGRAFLVFHNFGTIMRWNKSTFFAAAVGYLADSMGRG
jgi:membrane-bound lytic murein transglycosylase B